MKNEDCEAGDFAGKLVVQNTVAHEKANRCTVTSVSNDQNRDKTNTTYPVDHPPSSKHIRSRTTLPSPSKQALRPNQPHRLYGSPARCPYAAPHPRLRTEPSYRSFVMQPRQRVDTQGKREDSENVHLQHRTATQCRARKMRGPIRFR